MLTLGAHTLPQHGMRMWPAMIKSMLRPLAMKVVAERHSTMQVDEEGMTLGPHCMT